MHRLSVSEVTARLNEVPGWEVADSGELTRTVQLADFAQALLLVSAAGYLAERLQHHPNIDIRYATVTFSLVTHDAGGLTELDFSLAKQISTLIATES